MDEDELEEIEELCAAASPGPWFVRMLDDDHAMGLVAVSTEPFSSWLGRSRTVREPGVDIGRGSR